MTLIAPDSQQHPSRGTAGYEAVGSPSTNRILIRDTETFETVLELRPSQAAKLQRDLGGSLGLLDVFARARSDHAGSLYDAMRDADEHDPEHDPNAL